MSIFWPRRSWCPMPPARRPPFRPPAREASGSGCPSVARHGSPVSNASEAKRPGETHLLGLCPLLLGQRRVEDAELRGALEAEGAVVRLVGRQALDCLCARDTDGGQSRGGRKGARRRVLTRWTSSRSSTTGKGRGATGVRCTQRWEAGGGTYGGRRI